MAGSLAAEALEEFKQLAWNELQATGHNPDTLDEEVQTYYLKLSTAPDAYQLLITDLVHVWARRSDADMIEAERQVRLAFAARSSFLLGCAELQKYASSLKKQSVASTIK